MAIKLEHVTGEFLEVIPGKADPELIPFEILQTSNRVIEIQAVPLNQGQSISFSVFSTQSMENLDVTSLISGLDLRLQSTVDLPEQGISVWLVGFAVSFAFVGMLGLVYTEVRTRRRLRIIEDRAYRRRMGEQSE